MKWKVENVIPRWCQVVKGVSFIFWGNAGKITTKITHFNSVQYKVECFKCLLIRTEENIINIESPLFMTVLCEKVVLFAQDC